MNKHFYQQSYLQSSGWLPMKPLSQPVELGDFFQISRQQIRPLGSIKSSAMVEPIQQSDRLNLNPLDWQLKDQVRQLYSKHQQIEGEHQDHQWTQQVLEFSEPGSFIFYANNPNCQLILNWSKIKDELTIKLTQSEYSFRDIYVVTGVARLSDWGLAIADKPGAQLETTAQLRTNNHFDLFRHHSSITQASQDLFQFDKSNEDPCYFFKAKKLILSDTKRDQCLHHLLQQYDPREGQQPLNLLTGWLNTDLLNAQQTQQLNMANCIEFFDWADANLDDIAGLF